MKKYLPLILFLLLTALSVVILSNVQIEKISPLKDMGLWLMIGWLIVLYKLIPAPDPLSKEARKMLDERLKIGMKRQIAAIEELKKLQKIKGRNNKILKKDKKTNKRSK